MGGGGIGSPERSDTDTCLLRDPLPRSPTNSLSSWVRFGFSLWEENVILTYVVHVTYLPTPTPGNAPATLTRGSPAFTLKSAGVYSQYVFECILTPIHSDTRQIHVSPNDTHVSLVYAARMCVSFCIVGGWRCIHVLYICIVCIYIVS